MEGRRASPLPNLPALLLCLAIGVTSGCARPSIAHHDDAGANSPAGEQKLPFHQTPDRTADDSPHPALPPDPKSRSATPFRSPSHARSLPAGTLITVRLDSSLSISKVRPGDTFTASVAGSLAIDGDIRIERGTPVGGRIESAQPSVDRPGMSPDPGYLRLTLNTITVDGKILDLQTSSLFAKGTFQPSGLSTASTGNNQDGQSSDLQVQKGRRLTFRLTAPVTFADPNSVADRQYPRSANQ
jgi:hypothetical protein